MALRLNTDNDVLIKQIWEQQVWEESQERDVLTGFTGTYSDKFKSLPDGIVNRVMLPKGAYQANIGMLMDLDGAGTQGGGQLLTTENLAMKQLTAYANDVRHGVNMEEFGIFAHMLEAYDVMGQVNSKLAAWLKFRRGKHMRQALLQRYSDNLVQAPTSLSIGWNKNWLVKNSTDAGQPTYDSTLSAFTSDIITSLVDAGYGTDAQMDVQFFSTLEYYIKSVWKIQPLDNGKYIVTVAAKHARFLRDLSDSSSLARLQMGTFSQEIAKNGWAQTVLGEIGDMVLVVDERAPLLVYNTANGTLTGVYRDVGSVDDRAAYTQNVGNNRLYSVGGVWGKGAITEAIAMKPRYDEEKNDVGRLRDLGLSTTYGMRITEFDIDTATDSSNTAQNCAVFVAYDATGTA